MSDFLTRMAQYSRGEVALVTPVITGFFGPQAESESVATVMDVSAPLGEGVQPGIETAIPAVAAKSGVLLQPAIQNRAEPELSTAAEHAPPEPDRGGAVQRANLPESVSTDAYIADLHDPAFSHRAVQSHIQPANPVRRLSLAEKETGLRSDSATDDSDVPPAAGIRLVKQAPAVTAEPSSLLVPLGRSSSLPGDAQSVSLHDMVQLPTLAERDAQKEPAIHISIGRIDVRARTPAPVSVARTPRTKSASSLSLSAYLKRGGGGS